jgi:hypothetical protein
MQAEAGLWWALRVVASKTDAVERVVDLPPVLASELRKIKPLDADRDALVFATATGGKQSPLRPQVSGHHARHPID